MAIFLLGIIAGMIIGHGLGWSSCYRTLNPLLQIAHRDTRRFMQMWQQSQNALRKFGLEDETPKIDL